MKDKPEWNPEKKNLVIDASRPEVAAALDATLEGEDVSELERRRFDRLSPLGKFWVDVLMESQRRSGDPIPLSEAITSVEEVMAAH